MTSIAGYYWWTWASPSSLPPANTNMGICFSGAVRVNDALSSCKGMRVKLPGQKYLSIAGGDNYGRWTLGNLTDLNAAIKAKKLVGWDGICYDIETGEPGLSAAFANSFSIAKANNLAVLLAISNSQPYDIADAPQLMASFFSNANIDYICPQVYNDQMNGNNFYSWGTPWSAWAKAKAKIVISVVKGSRDYPGAVQFFKTQNINPVGYIQWDQGKNLRQEFKIHFKILFYCCLKLIIKVCERASICQYLKEVE